jgi:hypothetical protein
MQTKSMVVAVFAACVTCDVMAMYVLGKDWLSISEERARRLCAESGECEREFSVFSGRDFIKFLTHISSADEILQLGVYLTRR